MTPRPRRPFLVVMEVASARSRADAHSFYQQAGYIDCCPESGFFRKPLG